MHKLHQILTVARIVTGQSERSLMRGVIDFYDRSYSVDGRVYAGYEVIFADASKNRENTN